MDAGRSWVENVRAPVRIFLRPEVSVQKMDADPSTSSGQALGYPAQLPIHPKIIRFLCLGPLGPPAHHSVA